MSERELLAFAGAPNGRLLAIAQLLRSGHSASKVSEAVKLADKGDVEGALAVLFPKSKVQVRS